MSEINEGDTPGYESENLMLDNTQSISTTNDELLSARQSLPLVGDISANGRSRGMFKSICQRARRCDKKNLVPTIELAVEILREGPEGRRIVTLFTLDDADAILS